MFNNCSNCIFNDGVVYTSNPPQFKCTKTSEFHTGDFSCENYRSHNFQEADIVSKSIDGGTHKLVFDKKPDTYYDKWLKKSKCQLALNYIKDYIDVNGDLQGDDNNIAKMNRMCIETLQELIDEIGK